MYSTDNYIRAIDNELTARNNAVTAKKLLQEKESYIMLDIACGHFKAKNAEERKAIIEKEASNQIEYLHNCDELHREAMSILKKEEHYFELYKMNHRESLSDKDIEVSKNNIEASKIQLETSKSQADTAQKNLEIIGKK